MPHQCTNCARVFDDGSKEMLSGCPDCGGNKFQFRPDGIDAGDAASGGSAAGTTRTGASPSGDEQTGDSPDPPEPAGSSVARTVGKTAATVRDIVGGSGPDDPPVGAPDPSGFDPSVEPGVPEREDTAQASARSDVVAPDELPAAFASEPTHQFQPVRSDDDDPSASGAPSTDDGGTDPTAADASEADEGAAATTTDADDRPDLDELRAELNDQFESIKVLSPGQYELNLMELYDREEYIVALQEDGRYSIQVPENYRT